MTVPGEYAPLRFWRNTAVATLGPTDELTLGQNIVGYEWDPEYPEYADWYPAGRVLLSTTNLPSFAGSDQHHLSLYRAPSGALVFGAGTVQWSWGLDATHDYGTSTEDLNVQQATVNLFADMGVQPATLQSGLVTASASTDTAPPTVAVTSPAAGASVPGGALTITGTASDTGGAVGVVEISTDAGQTWRRASGRANWNYTYVAAEGTADIRVRAADDSLNLSTPLSHTFNVEPRVCSASSPCSLWDDATTPTEYKQNGNPIETGSRFRTDVAGFIRGIRFYIGQPTSATFTAHLWSNDGQLLGEADFPGAGALGWVEATFATPVPVQANTTYVASYFSPNTYYAYTNGYFATAGFANPPLYALRDGEAGANGVYRYDTPGFPTQTYQSSNYWIDVTFVEEFASHTFFDGALPARLERQRE
ncbi:MAG: DUF4082 domain-containing protein [Chloroflexi bacterium]|nr:DUF4082 domain-containing protein [Chloroflexota bacterium]